HQRPEPAQARAHQSEDHGQMKIPRLVLPLACLFATAAAAQQRSIFDPDDFVDPGQHAGPVFTSRLVLGAARNLIDDYRPTGGDADTHFTIGGHDVSGSLFYARTSRSGTVDDRNQQELAYTARPPGWAVARILVRPTLTVAAVSSRGATGLNVVNPALELFWH